MEDVVLSPEQARLVEREFLPHIDALYNFAYHFTYNDYDANELVQDALLRACRFVDKYEPGTNAKAWLFQILRNLFINNYRRKQAAPNMIEMDKVTMKQEREDETSSFSTFVDLREDLFNGLMGDEVTEAINKLSDNFKTIILLDLEDFTYEDIAEVLQIPLNTVRTRLFRARNSLKEQLYDYAKKQGFQDKRGKKELN